MKTFALVCLVSLLPALAHAADMASLIVTVVDVSDAGGRLRIGVYDQAGYKTKGTPVAGRIVRARPGKMTVEIDGIVPGTYAVKMFQDVNDDGFFDRSAKLVEPYGLSNDPPEGTGLPDFDDVKFTLTPGANSITVTLH